jgi:hypothetical protein
MIKNINDVSEHGNIGLFSIASYDSQFTLKHYYNVPLLPFTFRWTWKMGESKVGILWIK